MKYVRVKLGKEDELSIDHIEKVLASTPKLAHIGALLYRLSVSTVLSNREQIIPLVLNHLLKEL
jgi:hypothetical protein